MKLYRVVKSILAAGAFFSGLVVAQHLQPLSSSDRGFPDIMFVAETDAAAAIPEIDIERSDTDDTLAHRAQLEEKPTRVEPPRRVAIDHVAVEPAAKRVVAPVEHVAVVPPAAEVIIQPTETVSTVPSIAYNPSPVNTKDSRLLLVELPTLALEIDRRTIQPTLRGQFVAIAPAITRRAVLTDAESETRDVAPRAQEAAKQLAKAIDELRPLKQNPPVSKNAPNASDLVDGAEPSERNLRLSPELVELRGKIQRAVNIHRYRELNVREKSAWSVMHSMIGYGVDKKVVVDRRGNRASAIGWICYNKPCRGVPLFYLKNGRIHGRLGPGHQGHEGQFLAMLAQSKVRQNYPMKIGGKNFTVADLVAHEKERCRTNTELTFKLIGLSHYLKTDETWKNELGEEWDIPRVMQEEMRQPIVGAACGGTHRLFGLSYAINRHVHNGQPLSGQYRRAQIYVNDYQKYAFKLQNPDGSFSTKFFTGREAKNDEARRLLTSGHVAEWLSFSLTNEELTQPEMVKAIDYLASMLVRDEHRQWEVGPLGHTIHALNIYSDRVFKSDVPVRELASRTGE